MRARYHTPPPRLLKSLKSVSSCSSLFVAFPLLWWGFVIQTGLRDLNPSISSANIQMHNLFILSEPIHMHANDLCWPLFSPGAHCFGALKHILAVRRALLSRLYLVSFLQCRPTIENVTVYLDSFTSWQHDSLVARAHATQLSFEMSHPQSYEQRTLIRRMV